MRKRFEFLALIAGFFALLLAFAADASGWELSPAQSNINFISVKKDKVAEVHRFSVLRGGIAENGNARVSIELSSVDTGIDVRNERMRNYLFETQTFPVAEVQAKINPQMLADIKPGQVKQEDIALTLDLHGVQKEIQGHFQIVKLQDGRLLVNSAAPILISAEDFSLLAGINKLAELASLPMISAAVPVTFSLMFIEASQSG